MERWSYVFLALSGACLVLSWFGWLEKWLGFDPAWMTIIVSGVPIVKEATIGLITRRDIKAGVLVSLALIAAVAVGEYFAAGEVAFIMAIGELLENRTVAKAKASIKELLSIVPATARVRRDGQEYQVPIADVKVGDLVLVKPGEHIPVDDEVVAGQSSVNQAAITGESMPVDKTTGDEVYVGSLNQLGALEIRATKVGQDTTLAKVVRLVEEAERGKAPVVRTADRWATWMVPTALLIALVVYGFTGSLIRAVTVLIVFCPCALCLATPTAMMAAIGNAARRGILVKSGAAMELAGKITAIIFDKTGTLTRGRPEVTELRSFGGIGEKEMLALAAIAEKFSEHPLAQAIVKKASDEGLAIPDPDRFQVRLGHGVEAVSLGSAILVGNHKLMEQQTIPLPPESEAYVKEAEERGQTAIHVAVNGNLAGVIAVSDPVKTEASNAIQSLKERGIRQIWMLTGDNPRTAGAIAASTGIGNYLADQLPEHKGEAVKRLKEQGYQVAMVGDGINDAPALALADVGIAMGGGTDIAIQTADIALMSDNVSKIPQLIRISRKVLRTINVNILISMFINMAAIVLASLGIMGPIAGALVHNAGSVLVVANSSRLIKYA